MKERGMYTIPDWPKWVQEAFHQRFYRLELACGQQALRSSEDKNLLVQIETFRIKQNERIIKLLEENKEKYFPLQNDRGVFCNFFKEVENYKYYHD
jgi:hypothetical protein